MRAQYQRSVGGPFFPPGTGVGVVAPGEPGRGLDRSGHAATGTGATMPSGLRQRHRGFVCGGGGVSRWARPGKLASGGFLGRRPRLSVGHGRAKEPVEGPSRRHRSRTVWVENYHTEVKKGPIGTLRFLRRMARSMFEATSRGTSILLSANELI